MSSSAPLKGLLASGKVKWARSTSSGPSAAATHRWGVAGLLGSIVELIARGASGVWTTLAVLVRDAQAQGEPVAWVLQPDQSFYPPDLAASGVDLEALAVVRAGSEVEAWRAADELLRSGAFGLVVLDRAPLAAMPMSVQVRLANLAREHDAALICVDAEAGASGSGASGFGGSRAGRSGAGRSGFEGRGSLAVVRAESWRRRVAQGRFECGLRITKDKRRRSFTGRTEVCGGVAGLR